MSDPNFILLYVADVTRSAGFYAGLLGKAPVESSPTFAMFALDSGVMLGLWGSAGVVPPAGAAGGSELAFAVGSDDDVRSRCEAWVAKGVEVVQQPVTMDFGFTFTAVDPDRHRLRVFCPAGG
jgi:predicted enzyme related to lactoylglutathione lyase